MRRRSTVLLTGFGPFPGVPKNASGLLATKLAHLVARRFPGHRVVARVLPAEWDAAPLHIEKLYARERPGIAVHFGVSERARGFVIETVARNARAALADAKGMEPPAACIAEGGPASMATRAPAGEIVLRLRALGMPAKVSGDAGAYLCNAVYYRALGLAADGGEEMRVVFVHVPALLASGTGPLTWESALDGGLEIVRVCLGRPPRVNTRARR